LTIPFVPEMHMLVRLFAFSLAFLALGLCSTGAVGADVATAEEGGKPYTIQDGKVDQGTYNGWRRYTESCMRCHGPDGAGSSYAPDLTQSLKTLSEDDFRNVVINGRTNVNQANSNVMPQFGLVEDVMDYLPDIYAYLKARSDGVLDRGRPSRITQK
jgi:mono/diheme cytochrome c family protein